MGDLLDQNVLTLRNAYSRLNDVEQDSLMFLLEWIDVSLEMGLDADYRKRVEEQLRLL